MPLDDDYDDLPEVKNKSGLKNVSTQKSIFEGIPKKPSQEDLDRKVKNMEDKDFDFKNRTSELASKFKDLMADKTLPQNKSLFAKEIEKEILSSIVGLAFEINNDPNEKEGMGSLSWIAQLLKTSLSQRDRLNKLEYAFLQLEKKFSDIVKREAVTKENIGGLDNSKNSG